MYYLFTQDRALLTDLFPSIVKAVDYLRREISVNKYGLLPPAHPYDNEMIEGHYTSTNLWAILGLRYSIRLAQELGRTDVLADWKALEKQYSSNILKAIEVCSRMDMYRRDCMISRRANRLVPVWMNTVPIVIGRICCWLILQNCSNRNIRMYNLH